MWRSSVRPVTEFRSSSAEAMTALLVVVPKSRPIRVTMVPCRIAHFCPSILIFASLVLQHPLRRPLDQLGDIAQIQLRRRRGHHEHHAGVRDGADARDRPAHGGARSRDILRQFLVEAVVLCLMGGLLGIAVGRGAAITMTWLLRR